MHPHAQTMIKPWNPFQIPTRKLPLSCPILTRLLGGGIPVGSVTELSSESASGKTQLSLHLLLSSPDPSLFIHTDFPFPIRRLRTLASDPANLDPDPLDRIFVSSAHSPYDLLALLSHAQTAVLPRLPVRLIVVDSIAALFRSDFDSSAADLRRRSGLFFRIAGKLKEIARAFKLAVVVTNHVVDVVEEQGGVRVGNYSELRTSGRRVWPAMGLAWASCVNTRLFLEREEEVFEGEEDGGAGQRTRARRKMRVVFAPHLPQGSAEFVIVKGGSFGVRLCS